MAHGDSVRDVEQKRAKELVEVVDDLAHVARMALMQFVHPLNERSIPLLVPRSYVKKRLRLTAVGAFGSPIDRESTIDDLPRSTISLIRQPISTEDDEAQPAVEDQQGS